MILKELSEHNTKWKQIAYNICGCKMLADDLVQNMYLKLMNKTKWNEWFVRITLRNLFIDVVRKKKNVSLDELHYLEDKTTIFTPNDEQQSVLDEFNKLDWVSKQLLLESLDKSLRQIQAEYNINYGYTHRQVTKAKETILNNANCKTINRIKN